ncbi:hypothetical protein BO78DRAFT_437930 [Aspergillus sclerotiicarbonarius CBS 121057]|uniref:LysM domain-containing protein n=1 Tax=Aspergillus sclerotiicarbonarius (strain CBS 121057 / IBT 28362) TaxID=1448318 RepID=A0A319EI87_ASPSB|nr:hypothetical protein BO78DRAFT_437930 [Aspergillus sclerotiicarbonarius CBS 121057]
MILPSLLALAILGSANGLAIQKRFDNGDFPTGDTDPNVTSALATTVAATSTVSTLSSSSSSIATTTTAAVTTTAASGPSPTQTGLISTCDAFYYVQPGDSCWAIANSYSNFTLNEFYSWNPAVKTDCSGLQSDYYVCIGVAGSTTAASSTTLPATTTSSATPTGSYLPQQTGIASNCDDYYYVQHGDTCSAIATNHDISLSNFYTWNPAVGTTCSGLEADYWVCVGVSGGNSATTTTPPTTTTSIPTTSTTGTAPSPTQSGLVADCSTYYPAKSGDSCWSIVNDEYTYLTTSLFEQWNPAMGSDCSNLQIGYYYCVATQDQAPMPDMISTCTKWHLVASGDNCWSIEQGAGISASDFASWNPYVGSSCANLWLGYYVCVGV